MKSNKFFIAFAILLNIAGLACVIRFGIPYITHDTYIANPDSMLPAEAWDSAGMRLTIGFFPLLIANALGALCIKNNKLTKFACFIPSILCLIMVLSYVLPSLIN